MDEKSLSHTSWNCKYHIVLVPKYRRKVIYGKLRKDIGKILRMQDQMSDQLSFREYEDPFKNIADLDDDSPDIPTDSRIKK